MELCNSYRKHLSWPSYIFLTFFYINCDIWNFLKRECQKKNAAFHFRHINPIYRDKSIYLLYFYSLFSPPPSYLSMLGHVDKNKLRDIRSFNPVSQLDTQTKKHIQNCCLCSRLSRIYQACYLSKLACPLCIHFLLPLFGLFFWLEPWGGLRGVLSFFV